MTDCKTSNQMGTREREMPEIYMLPALWGICHTNWENKNHRTEGERMGSGSEFKHCEKVSERKGEEPKSAATSAGSYLDQLIFFFSGRSWTHTFVHLPPACWSAMGGLFFFSLVVHHISSSYPVAEMVTQDQKSNSLFFGCILIQLFASQ